MNVFRLSCRNFRPLIVLFTAVVLVYVGLNIIYISISSSDASSSRREVDADDSGLIAAHLKFKAPDKNGKVEVVVSLDMKQLAGLLRNSDLDGLFVPGGNNDDYPAGDSAAAVNLTGSLPVNVNYTLVNPALCSDLDVSADVRWIAIVSSTPAETDRRMLLRETWANSHLFLKNTFKTVFVMGLTADQSVLSVVHNEFDKYHDILLGNFLDTSRNSTLKVLMALQYVMQYCSSADYVIKANDDTFLNVFQLMNVMRSARIYQDTVICPLWQDNTMPILRNPKECMEWCVAENELPGRTHFPQYCAGLAYVLSRHLASAIFNVSRTTPYFWIDDVHITGILMPQVAKITKRLHYVDIVNNFTQVEKDVEAQYANRGRPITYIAAKIRSAEIFRRAWKSLIERLPPTQFKLLSDKAIAAL